VADMRTNSALEKVFVIIFAFSSVACQGLSVPAQENCDEKKAVGTSEAGLPDKLNSVPSSTLAKKP
jgi:hypothetical protein